MRSGKVVNVLGGGAPTQSAVAKAKEPSPPDKSAADCNGYVIEWPDLDEHIGMKGCWPAGLAVSGKHCCRGGWPAARCGLRMTAV